MTTTESRASLATAREIDQQPDVWRECAHIISTRRAAIDGFLAPLVARPDLRIILTGAGTSAFVGDIAAPALTGLLGRRVDAVATTDIVSNPRQYLGEDLPTLLVSFARSGNSPESSAAANVADEVLTTVHHLIITCDPSGALSVDHQGREGSHVVLMPTRSNDTGFAMTSSFTSMLLASLLIFGGDDDATVDKLQVAAADLLEQRSDKITRLARPEIERVIYLGSGALTGLARESALKLLELTAGKVVTYYDSALGFRHGPKAVLDDSTLVLVYVSSDAYTRQYDLDIVAELRVTLPADRVITISSAPTSTTSDNDWVLPDLAGLTDAQLAIAYVVIAQLLGLSFSIQLGMTPDNPFPDGTVNRVVQGVTIHPLGSSSGSALPGEE
jgi:tagatose-6-phosphate ketose/aldose isomerase